MKDRSIIISVDTALKPLLSIGVEPHIVVASDPQPVNAQKFSDLPPLKTALVGEPSLDRRIFENYPGPIRLCAEAPI